MKKLFLSITILVIILLAILNVGFSFSKKNNANLFLMNVEALADNESSYDGDCSKKGGECSVKLPQGSQLIILNIQKP